MSEIPETLANVTPLPPPQPGKWERRNRRARSNIPGRRANTLPPVLPGEKIWRISVDSDIGRVTLRRWGRRHGYQVADKGKIPGQVRDAFMKQNAIWTVKEITRQYTGPGGRQVTSRMYQVKQGQYLVTLHHGRTETTDPFYVKRVLGDELFPLLKRVET